MNSSIYIVCEDGTKHNLQFSEFPDKTLFLEVAPYPNKFTDNSVLFDSNNKYKQIDWVVWDYKDHRSLVELMLVANTSFFRDTRLFINYLPYGRQDKDHSGCGYQPASLWLLRTHLAEFREVVAVDVHNNLPSFSKSMNLKSVHHHDFHNSIIIFPDMGAYNRYKNDPIIINNDFIVVNKTRIKGEVTHDDEGLSEQLEKLIRKYPYHNVTVYDDILDGGATFISLSEKIEAAVKRIAQRCDDITLCDGIGEFSLSVSHVIDESVIPKLKGRFEAIQYRKFNINEPSFSEHVYLPLNEI